MRNIINILLKISPALEAGQSLKNSETWSNVAQSTYALVAVFGFLLLAAKSFGFDLGISDAQLFSLAAAIAGIGGSVSSYLHIATRSSKGIVRK